MKGNGALMMRYVAIGGLWLLGTLTVAQAATCIVPNFKVLDNQTVNGTMYATSGKPCGVILISSPGPIFNARIITQPSNGRASIQGPRIVYLSRPGYVGDDRFTCARSGMDARSQPVSRTVEMSVKVADHW
jgi:hypothetical protein